ncbi:MAG TPA: helix-turn-helix transcriptional regulator [Acidimicrobiales bacterium]|nr:helix-turn-helix transcriptional regulator [Acidimicrobiales bacterium]
MAKQTKSSDGTGGVPDELRARNLLRPAMLLLLKEHESHGYELVSRLSELGFDVPDFGGLYRSLRAMEDEGVVSSHWGTPARGPARRVYAITPEGERQLRESAPVLVQQRRAIGGLLDRYRGLVHQERKSKRQRRRVLVVEDDDDMRHTLWVLLEQRGWIVEEAPDGEAALARWSSSRDGIVLLDQRMPGMSGIEVARRMRDDGFQGAILLYSAYLSPELEASAAELDVRTLGKADFTELFEVLGEFEDGAPPREPGSG